MSNSSAITCSWIQALNTARNSSRSTVSGWSTKKLTLRCCESLSLPFCGSALHARSHLAFHQHRAYKALPQNATWPSINIAPARRSHKMLPTLAGPNYRWQDGDGADAGAATVGCLDHQLSFLDAL